MLITISDAKNEPRGFLMELCKLKLRPRYYKGSIKHLRRKKTRAKIISGRPIFCFKTRSVPIRDSYLSQQRSRAELIRDRDDNYEPRFFKQSDKLGRFASVFV